MRPVFACYSTLQKRSSPEGPVAERLLILDKVHMNVARPQVLVIGGGFGGLECCKKLAKSDVDVSLVDRQNYHLFQPLLYQVATAALSPADIAHPIRRILRNQTNVHVYMAEALGVDLEKQVVEFRTGRAHYDYLVLAAGATHSYFGNEIWNVEAPGLKSVDDATEIRKRILLAFEEAEYEADLDSQRSKLTFVIVGGGPTGVELAGALKEIAVDTIPEDFRNVDTKTARIILVHSGPRLLQSFSESLSESALKDLQNMGVEVRLNSRVTGIDAEGVLVGTERIAAENIFWAAGVQAAPIGTTLGVPADSQGRIKVNPDLTIPGHPEVFVIGDMASVTDPDTGISVPGVAQAAIQAGKFVAERISGRIANSELPKSEHVFRYRNKGNMATVGRAKAIAEIGRFRFHGWFAWVLWSLVHVLVLVGFRNRMSVLLSWLASYVFSSRGARLITGKTSFSVRKFREHAPTKMQILETNGHETIPKTDSVNRPAQQLP